MYRSIHFSYSGPNEWEFDENDNPLRPGARELAELIAAKLRLNSTSVYPVTQHSFYGWAFAVVFEKVKFHQVLNPVAEDCRLTINLPLYWLRAATLKQPRQTFNRYCTIVEAVLKKIPTVTGLRWDDFRS
jgi:hypothetical protein